MRKRVGIWPWVEIFATVFAMESAMNELKLQQQIAMQ
jgi:hypothetical protein